MNEKLSNILKGLKKQRESLRQKILAYCTEKEVILKAINDTKQKIAKIDKEIKKIEDSNKDITISEHAIIRYLERSNQIDVEKIKKEILPENIKETIKTLGDGTYSIGNGFRIKVKSNNVLTVIN